MSNQQSNKTKFIAGILAMTSLAAIAPFAINNPANASIFDRIIERLPNQVDATISFRNETDKPIIVVMDSGREERLIAPRGRATFSKANVGDAPTFWVLDANARQTLYSRKVGPIGLKSSFGFNGSRF